MSSLLHCIRVFAILTLVLIVAHTSNGCRVGDLSKFSMQPNSGWPIEGKIVDNVNAVDVYADNAMRVSSGGAVAFRNRELTDGHFSMQLALQAGNSVTLQMRTTPHSDSLLQDPGISVTIRNGVVTVAAVTPQAPVPVNIQPDVPFIVEIANDGPWIDITVACTHIGRFATARPSTEWVILRSNDQASFTMVDPTFRPLYSED